LRPIAVTSIKRSSLLPDLPTIAESGLSGFNVTSWYGVFAPAKLPGDIATKLNGEIRALMNANDVKSKLSNVGAEVDTNTPAEFAQLVRSEIARWAKVVKASGATVN
ncbi:MAG: tripartite tricarboxylate transporter substrate binding protein, partial [Betaproteobacteria bacterium]|nr:tripartite tricarboxylate transporter substrate binding protein [Betaproteobacteria bacterium]